MNKTNHSEKNLQTECVVFSFYLTGEKPNDYVIKKYQQGHSPRNLVPDSLFDKILISLAALHPWLARLSDTYSRIFFQKSILRQKLVLLLAIMESSAPTYKYFDNSEVSSKPYLLMKLVWLGLSFIVILLVATVFLLPLQLLTQATDLFSKNAGGQ